MRTLVAAGVLASCHADVADRSSSVPTDDDAVRARDTDDGVSTREPGDTDADDGCLVAVPPDLGEGFVDITPSVVASNRGWGDAAHHGLFTDFVAGVGDLDGDGRPEFVLASVLGPPDAPTDYYPVFTLDGDAWVAFAELPSLWANRGPHDPQEDLIAPGHVVRHMTVMPLIANGGDQPQLLLDGVLVRRDPTAGVWRVVDDAFPPNEVCNFALGSDFGIQILDLDQDGWLDVQRSSGPLEYPCTEEAFVTLFQTRPGAWEHRQVLAPGPSQDVYAFATWWREPGGPALISMAGGVHDGSSIPYGSYVQDGEDAQGYPTLRHLPGTGRRNPTYNPMAAAFIDLDEDGVPEHILATTERQLRVEWAAPGGVWPWEGGWFDVSPMLAMQHRRAGIVPHMNIPWATVPIDVDRDGRVDVLCAHGDDFEFLHDHGFRYFLQAWWNPGTCQGTWRRMPEWLPSHAQDPLGAEVNERGVVLWDFEGDGDADLVIGGFYTGRPRVLRNNVEGGHGLTLQLVGRTSNTPGIGAEVEVSTEDGRVQRHQFGSWGSPNAVVYPTWSPGLGTHRRASVRVRWPSGFVQDAGWLASGAAYKIEEPPLLTVQPPSRRVSVGGEEVVATFCPYAADGASIRTDQVVVAQLESFGAQPTLIGASLGPSGCTHVRINPGSRPGSFRIAGSFVGGAHSLTLRVRPRIWVE